MTGVHNEGVDNPLSRLTIASLEDLGYEVRYDAAENYELPTAHMLAAMGVGENVAHRRCCEIGGPEQIVALNRNRRS